MFLRDFRPKSFEYNGVPLSVTSDGIVFDTNNIIPADTSYNDGNRTSKIDVSATFEITDGSIDRLVNGNTDYVKLKMDDNTPDGNYVHFTFATPQDFNQIMITGKAWAYTPTINFYCSDNNKTWHHFATSRFENVEKTYFIPVNLPVGNFKYFKFGSLTEDNSVSGYLRKLEFNIIDKTVFEPIVQSVDDGRLEFDVSNIEQVDDSGNKVVSFNIMNNDKVATTGTVTQNYEIMHFVGERVSNDRIIPGNTIINTYLDVKKSLFVSAGLTTGSGANIKGILQVGTSTSGQPSTIKMFDKHNKGQNSGDWVDFVIQNKKIYLDGLEYSSGEGGGVTIDDIISSSTTTFSSEKILSEIDDFDKIDSYLGAYYKTNNDLFDKYIDIDTLLGKVLEGTASSEEIELSDILNEQLGLLSLIDSDIVEYIDLKLGN